MAIPSCYAVVVVIHDADCHWRHCLPATVGLSGDHLIPTVLAVTDAPHDHLTMELPMAMTLHPESAYHLNYTTTIRLCSVTSND